MTPIETFILASYFFVLLVLAVYGWHRYYLVYLYMKHKTEQPVPAAQFQDLPTITIQLPLFNEMYVVDRLIDAVCAIDYPRDRLEIQVLDDSTDHSAQIAQAAVEQWAAKGYPIKYIHRANRVGYKAGALEAGLKTATGEFIAIFDADFVPPRDILHNVVDYFTDDKIGMVQIRWDHLNRDASLLTKSQAIFLDGHFVIEHTARNRSGRFMHFNGTAGVWRRTTIADGGGWQHDTLTEDLDLSYRCQLKGWQFVYLPQYAAPAELPPEMIGFKQQAYRWTKGSFQTAIKLLPRILRSPSLPRHVKGEAFFHLTNTIVYPLMVLLTLLMYPTFIGFATVLKANTWGNYVFSFSLFVLATCSATTFFIFGQKELFGREAGWRTLLYMPALMSLGVGVSLNNAKAVLDAIWTAYRRKPSEFVRTPKYGVSGQSKAKLKQKGIFTFSRLALPIIEIAFGCYMLCCTWISVWYLCGLWPGQPKSGIFTVPFLLIFASGFFYVGFGSLWAMWQMHREATEAQREVLPVGEDVEPLQTT